jgi:hypothetical protein
MDSCTYLDRGGNNGVLAAGGVGAASYMVDVLGSRLWSNSRGSSPALVGHPARGGKQRRECNCSEQHRGTLPAAEAYKRGSVFDSVAATSALRTRDITQPPSRGPFATWVTLCTNHPTRLAVSGSLGDCPRSNKTKAAGHSAKSTSSEDY